MAVRALLMQILKCCLSYKFSGGKVGAVKRGDPAQTLDVLEMENVLLECRFPEGLTDRDREYTLYWIRSNRHGHDNVAIGGLQLENNYS